MVSIRHHLLSVKPSIGEVLRIMNSLASDINLLKRGIAFKFCPRFWEMSLCRKLRSRELKGTFFREGHSNGAATPKIGRGTGGWWA